MNQCVPSWDLDHDSSTLHPGLDYEVAELTWKNGQLAMHGLGPPRVPPTKYTAWDKPRAGAGTLESIVNQATRLPCPKSASGGGGDDLVPWFDHRKSTANPAASASMSMTMDALVPCNNNNNIISRNDNPVPSHVLESGTCVVGCSTRVGSCSGFAATLDGGAVGGNHRDPRVDDLNSCDETNGSASESATCGLDSRQLTRDTYEKELGAAGFTSPSPEDTSSGKECSKSTGEDLDSVCHSRRQRDKCDDEGKKRGIGKSSSVLTKRSRAAAIHNQSERKRRDRINQRMKTLQKLVPNSSKTDKASMLDEVIEYVKQMQSQVQFMKMNMSQMNMLPLAAMQQHQQLQMSMMNPVGMSMGMGMGVGMGMGMGIMDMNAMGRPGAGMLPPPMAGIPPATASFMPVGASWDNPGERLQGPASVATDPLSMFMAWQSQLMTIDAYNRLAAMYQQFQQPPGPSSKN